jgi:hypothetical protein
LDEHLNEGKCDPSFQDRVNPATQNANANSYKTRECRARVRSLTRVADEQDADADAYNGQNDVHEGCQDGTDSPQGTHERHNTQTPLQLQHVMGSDVVTTTREWKWK